MSKILNEKIEKMSEKEKQLWALRHTSEHVLHAAMQNLYPELLKAMGPATKEGFYFDFELNKAISDADFPKIEKEMKRLIDLDIPMTQEEVTPKKAKEIFKDNPYKLEWVKEIEKRGEDVSIYKMGDKDLDLCSGPHAKSTGEIKAFKLLSVAGAYWHGDEKNKMLTRIYGTAFPTQEELDHYLWQKEEAEKRDHRKLNQTLKLYMESEELGQGLITLLPNGAIIAEELEKWAKETEEKWGYVRVFTPHIASDVLFKRTGHVPYYLASMYPPMRMEEKGEDEKDVYYLKPMNCAGHHLVFKSEPRSYRDLPLRIAEYGAVYRYERSGELHGMMRVRGPIHQNDAHIFCTEEQAEEEFQSVMKLHKYYYDALGLTEKDYFLSFAVRDKNNKKKYLGDENLWDKAEQITLDFVKKSNIPYEIEEGGAAFYGPKIDFNIRTVTGKVFSASTNQLDFFIPRAFELKYVDKVGKEKTPVCIHRAPLGAHVRFLAFLTEHFAGNFPFWLQPVQVVIIPIADRHISYANSVKEALKNAGVRVKTDDRPETMQAKIRDAQVQKIPYMIILGDREVENKAISVRKRSGENLNNISLETFLEEAKNAIATRSSTW